MFDPWPSVARLGVFPLDLGDFWSFSGKFRGRNSLVGKFSGFFLFRVFLGVYLILF